jgi:hypothetical protein
VNGTAVAVASWTHGNDLVGGTSNGQAAGGFLATDLCKAVGTGNAFANATGSSSSGPKSATSTSQGFVNSDAQANGGLSASVNLSGSSEQLNFAQTGAGSNFSSGANYTQGSYDGSVNNTPEAKGFGQGVSKGTTDVSTSATSTSAQSNAITKGSSVGDMMFNGAGTGTSSASGEGGISAQSTLGGGTGDHFFAGGSVSGNAAYNSTGALVSAGSLVVKGVTTGNVTSTSSSACSTVNSIATAIGGPCGAGGCIDKK